LLLEDSFVQGSGTITISDPFGGDLRRTVPELEATLEVGVRVGAFEKQTDNLLVIAGELAQARELLGSPRIRLVVRQDFAEDFLCEADIPEGDFGQLRGLARELVLALWIAFELGEPAQRRYAITLATRTSTKLLQRANELHVLRIGVECLGVGFF